MNNFKFNTIDEAIADLKHGKVIIVCDDESRENEGDFIALSEYTTPEVVNFMITHGKGLLCMSITESCAERLNLQPMIGHNTDNHQTAFTVSVDHVDTSTGISAYDRALTINKILDQNLSASDFRRPGHIFPLVAREGGVFVRQGHTEASVDLAKLCGKKPSGVICEIIKSDGSMARRDDLMLIAQKFNLKIITIKDLIIYRKKVEKIVKQEVKVELPTALGKFNIIGYSNIIDSEEHIAITKGDNYLNSTPLVRIHSECLTGDEIGRAHV